MSEQTPAGTQQIGDGVSTSWKGLGWEVESASMPPTLWATGIVKREAPVPIPGAGDKPGDVTLSNWSEGKTRVFDLVVTSPVCSAYVAQAALESGYAARLAERRKDDTAFAKCEEQGLVFVPLPWLWKPSAGRVRWLARPSMF